MQHAESRSGFAVLAGPPNSGKSTLLNALLGQKIAIVSPKPQTTRNQITGILTDADGQIVFLDTPGLHEKRGLMNRMLMHSAQQALQIASVVVLVLDASRYAKRPEAFHQALTRLHESLAGAPALVALNKVDVVADKPSLLPLLEISATVWPEAELFPISALTGQGLPELLAAVRRRLPVGPPLFPEDQVSTVTVRFMAAEIIREKLFLNLRQELPYSVGVDIERWEEDPATGHVTIGAVIYVTRAAHKPIVIGKRGELLKTVGTLARVELAELLEQKVHLELWVKVREEWTEDPNILQELGLGT